jgi:hypothetical protein
MCDALSNMLNNGTDRFKFWVEVRALLLLLILLKTEHLTHSVIHVSPERNALHGYDYFPHIALLTASKKH